jgi:hypothetical protein
MVDPTRCGCALGLRRERRPNFSGSGLGLMLQATGRTHMQIAEEAVHAEMLSTSFGGAAVSKILTIYYSKSNNQFKTGHHVDN